MGRAPPPSGARPGTSLFQYQKTCDVPGGRANFLSDIPEGRVIFLVISPGVGQYSSSDSPGGRATDNIYFFKRKANFQFSFIYND